MFTGLVIITGSTYTAVDITASKLFGLAIFNNGLTSMDLIHFQDLKVVNSVVLENIPQLIVQIVFLALYGVGQSSVVLYALVSSGLSITTVVIGYLLMKKFSDMSSSVLICCVLCSALCEVRPHCTRNTTTLVTHRVMSWLPKHPLG